MVVVTGAAGFVASYVVKELLARGYRVRGTVRHGSNHHLLRLPGAEERLELVRADLLAEGAFDSVVAGADAVIHTASPYVLTVNDPQRDLVDPAVAGTRNVMSACAKSPSVKRLVLTSSMAAVTDEPPDHVLTEADWNTKSSLTRNPYYYSKTLAEREAWRLTEELRPGFDLVSINPFLVIGPAMNDALNQSNKVLADMLNGAFPGIISLMWGFVDVRDVALAHVLAMETPAASGRYLCAAAAMSMREVGDLLRSSGYGAYKIPSIALDHSLGTRLAKLASYAEKKGIGDYLRSHVGRTLRFDNSKIRGELGLEFRDVSASILETVEDLIRHGHVRKR